MGSVELLTDAFGRLREEVHDAASGLGAEALNYRLDAEANSIAWLLWHLTRVQDDHVAGVADIEQVWLSGGWADEFGLPLSPLDIGYGHSSDQVASVRLESAELLTDYHDAVHKQTVDYVSGITDTDLDVAVDAAWDPPVTLGVRLVSVISDGLQHVGQAAFVKGIVLRR
ncbi:Protein of unknown function (DUF664) [Saccharomonospora marina XMU15]|uniref:DinB-like domain-containing protein n=1 Tax=Saccharomonospora marina XMU15 TaxID=882083 RepID=H5X016_9PSEU|nr:DUF664 domain-containing protein [Saccharomonospora marina]EHR53012.1 Protein of unknown function (DUF664) [Saccharomonospora marina XMU15]